MPERLWYLKNCQLFERLTEEQLARLEQRARIRRFPKNNPIYLQSQEAEGVYLLVEGRVKLCSFTPEGKQTILALIEPGELFGELALFGESRREEQAETMAASIIAMLPGDSLESLMQESPELTLGVTKLLGFRRRRIERRIKALLFRSSRDRIVHLLLDLTEQYGEPTSEGVLLSIKLSHQDLASIIGVTRETVTVLLGELQLEGLLKVSRQRIVIRDVARLAQCTHAAAPPVGGPAAKESGGVLAPRRKLRPEA
ncbi:MAG: Crp/Fnr family transcriptional regulator [Planctomycetes bacterium]|nr:Crp/Fnr family transcriptional regulator [Planctomycetota bacterium]